MIKRILLFIILLIPILHSKAQQSDTLWHMANSNKNLLRVSVIFTVRDVGSYLSSEEGLQDAINWCKKTGITRVFIESYRRNYAEREVLENARDRFRHAGIEASGAVMPSGIGRKSTGWGLVSCYTDRETQDELQKVFEYTASMFDIIMIDDAWFTDCECEKCITARGNQTWTKYRTDLMLKMSNERVLTPARAINPDVKVILKYPLWYDGFHERGYDVDRETKAFDMIWVGTETRNYDYDKNPGGKVQYSAYYIMRWLGSIGGGKTGGGWFDPLGTTPQTFVEQARQTVIGDANELMMYSYGHLQRKTNTYSGWQGTGVADVEAFRAELPALFKLAAIVKGKSIKGVLAPKIPNSEAFDELYVHGFFGMMGIPLVPSHVIDEQAESAIFSVQVLKDPYFSVKLDNMLKAGKPVLITDGLAKRLSNKTLLENKNLNVIKVEGEPRDLIKLSKEELKNTRDRLLEPLGLKFDAPNKVALYLIGDNHIIIENFNDKPVSATLEFNKMFGAEKLLTISQDAIVRYSFKEQKLKLHSIAPRTLVVFEY